MRSLFIAALLLLTCCGNREDAFRVAEQDVHECVPPAEYGPLIQRRDSGGETIPPCIWNEFHAPLFLWEPPHIQAHWQRPHYGGYAVYGRVCWGLKTVGEDGLELGYLVVHDPP